MSHLFIHFCTHFCPVQVFERGNVGSFRTTFQEEAWKRYNKRLQEEYEEEMERVERIRRMQDVFNRERNKYRRNPWKENGSGTHHQNFQRDDWYWKAEQTFRDQWKNYPRENGSINCSLLSHHYSVLGLDRYSQKSSVFVYSILHRQKLYQNAVIPLSVFNSSTIF